jgi:hypothetical protein
MCPPLDFVLPKVAGFDNPLDAELPKTQHSDLPALQI